MLLLCLSMTKTGQESVHERDHSQPKSGHGLEDGYSDEQ